jgi:hypothetical protein
MDSETAHTLNQFREDVIEELARIHTDIAAVHRACLAACGRNADERALTALQDFRLRLASEERSFVDELRGKFRIPKLK